jgi:hypothetical protein
LHAKPRRLATLLFAITAVCSWSKRKLARSFYASGTFHNNRRVHVGLPVGYDDTANATKKSSSSTSSMVKRLSLLLKMRADETLTELITSGKICLPAQ